MKKFLLLTTILFSSCFSYSQVDTLLLSPDAIFEPGDSVMIDDWLYLAKYADEIDSTISYAHAAFFIAKQIENGRGQINSLKVLAPSYMKIGENTRGLRKYLILANLENRTHRWNDLYTTFNNIADYFSSIGQWSNALTYRQRAYDLAITHKLAIDFIPLLRNLASLSKEADQFSEALAYWSTIDSISEGLNDLHLKFESSHQKVSIYYDKKDVVNALSEIEKINDLVKKYPVEANNFFPEYWTLLPILYIELKLPKKALYWIATNEKYQDSISFSKETLNAFKLIRGIALLQSKKSEEAKLIFEDLYDHKVEFSEGENWSSVLFDALLLGDIMESDRRVDKEQLRILDKMQRSKEKMGYRFPLTPVCVYLEENDYVKAYNGFRSFMTYADSIHAEHTLISVSDTGALPSVPYIWVINQISIIKEALFSTLLTEAEHSLLTEENQRIVTSLKSLWETYLEAKENRERAASRLQQLQAENQRLAERERELLEHNRIKELELLEEVNKSQTLKIEKDKAVRHRLIVFLVSVIMLGGLIFYSWRSVKKKNILLSESREIIRREKDKSDKLLLNILPHSTAEELKINGVATSRFYKEVSILFTDFSGFTKLAEGLKAEELVEQLNEYFKAFDEIVANLGLEKIKTIGDSYMCAGGLPSQSDDHAEKILQAAFIISEKTDEINDYKRKNGLSPWPLRIGIHTGPVVAGVIGTKKFAYDIWGDSVNVAARMEQTSVPGKINISESTKQKLKGEYTFEERGEIEAKNKGKIKMYFVSKE